MDEKIKYIMESNEIRNKLCKMGICPVVGPTGPKGEKGDIGPVGEAGISHEFIVGETKTINPDEPAKVQDEFNNNKNSTSMMFAYGKIIYDLDDTVKYLQSKALEYVDSSFNEITSMKLDTNNYHLWNYLNKLKVMLKEDNPEFNLIYYSLLSDVYDMYSEFLGLSKLPKSKVYKILSSEDYRRKHHIFKLPEEEFIKLYLKCFELDKPSIMYNNMEKLINYYYKKQGGFNIRTFEITTQ